MERNWKRIAAAVCAGAGALLLSGCLLSAGKFDSTLSLMKDGSFSYRYDGEIQMLALSELADMTNAVEEAFEPTACYTDEFEERECTTDEIAGQKAEWDAGTAERAAKRESDAEMAKALLGGIDPSDPEAATEIAARLERQHGWSKVSYIGKGLFKVEYAITGRMTHDFAFPVIERMPMSNSFVSVVLRDGGEVRVDAPAFVVQDAANPMRAVMAGMAGIGKTMSEQEEAEDTGARQAPRIVFPHGTFTIVTDGAILANNTDEGPAAHPRGKQLVWSVDARSRQPPMALIDLSH